MTEGKASDTDGHKPIDCDEDTESLSSLKQGIIGDFSSLSEFSEANGFIDDRFIILPLPNPDQQHFKISINDIVSGIRRLEIAYDPLSLVRAPLAQDDKKTNIALITQGSCSVSTNSGKGFEIKAGDLVISSVADIAEFSSNGHEARLFELDKSLIRWSASIERIHQPFVLKKSASSSRLMRSYFRAIWQQFEFLTPRERFIFLQNFIDLYFASISNEQFEESTPYRTALVRRIKEYSRDNIKESSLRAKSVAEKFGFTVRYLHRLFEGEGVTFGIWLRNERLARAREALLLSGSQVLTVKQIAYQFGFTDSSHFCRSFKQRFGLTPTQFRDQTQGEVKKRTEMLISALDAP